MIFLWFFQIGWDHLLTESPPGTAIRFDGDVVEIDLQKQAVVPLMIWHDPPISGPQYELNFEIQGDLSGQAYLEMWSIFEDGSRYFTRTLAESGPTAYVEGSFSWRKISLPFDTQGKVPSPVSLEINVISDQGTLWLRNVELNSAGTNGIFSLKSLVIGFFAVFLMGIVLIGVLVYLQKQKNQRRMRSLDL